MEKIDLSGLTIAPRNYWGPDENFVVEEYKGIKV